MYAKIVCNEWKSSHALLHDTSDLDGSSKQVVLLASSALETFCEDPRSQSFPAIEQRPFEAMFV